MSQPRTFFEEKFSKQPMWPGAKTAILAFLDAWETDERDGEPFSIDVSKSKAGGPCPRCGSDNVDAINDSVFYEDVAYNPMRCKQCNTIWLDEYSFKAPVPLPN